MKVEKRYEEGNWHVALSGDVDILEVDALRREIAEIGGADVEIDCADMTYIDSMGIGVLVSLLKRVKDGGHVVRLKGLKPHIQKIFVLTDLDKLFLIEGAET